MEKDDFKIIYEQDYCSRLDVTIIMEYIKNGNNILKKRVSGFYYGEPDLNCLIKFKENNELIVKEVK